MGLMGSTGMYQSPIPSVATAEAYCSASGKSGGDISQSSMACVAGAGHRQGGCVGGGTALQARWPLTGFQTNDPSPCVHMPA